MPCRDNSDFLLKFRCILVKVRIFAFLGVKDNNIEDIKILKTLGRHTGGKITPAEMILGSNADILLCANLGSKAVKMFREEGVKVFLGASGTVQYTFDEWKRDNLRLADEKSA